MYTMIHPDTPPILRKVFAFMDTLTKDELREFLDISIQDEATEYAYTALGLERPE